jgi:outer membrane protein assembly factor BamD
MCFGQGTAQQDQAAAADKEMSIGLYMLQGHNFPGAINRFKVVVTHYCASPLVPEALERLAEAYMTLGIVPEAQTAVAVLGRRFPESDWYKQSKSLLRSAGVEPREEAGSWISKACT